MIRAVQALGDRLLSAFVPAQPASACCGRLYCSGGNCCGCNCGGNGSCTCSCVPCSSC